MRILGAALLLTALACTQAHTVAANEMVVTGVITTEGAECLAMRGDDGKLYTLGRPENPPAAGTHVRVTGTVAEMSFCMQGITLNVTKIEKLPT